MKELDSVYNDEMDEEAGDALKKSNFIVIAKLLKYKEETLLKEKEYTNFLDEKIKRGTHKREIINLFFEKIIEEIDENLPHQDFMKEEDFIIQNFTIKRYAYDIVLHLILQNFSWNDMISSNNNQTDSIELLNLYFFYIIHKYSNSKNKIILQNEKYKLKKEVRQVFSNLIDKLLSPSLNSSILLEPVSPQYLGDYSRIMLFLKYLNVFTVFSEDREIVGSILEMLNQKLYEKLQVQNLQTADVVIQAKDLYVLPETLRKQFEFVVFKRGQDKISLRELLISLKGETISKMSQFVNIDSQNKIKNLTTLIHSEFQFLSANKKHIHYVQNFNHFLEGILNDIKTHSAELKDSLGSDFIIKNGKVYLSLEKYAHYITDFASNLSSSAGPLRRYTLEILTKIQQYQFPAVKANQESTITGDCDALQLCLHVTFY